jgi:HD superfamily phosphohydrolase
MAEKIIRDPVHDVIAFQLEKPIDALLFRLINAVEFQRLRRIRQLGLASLAYPGAEHSRYSHSLGVMQTARRILDQLSRSFKLEEGSVAVCLAGALLHDLGHGPFSHVFERVSGIDHESITHRIIADPHSQVHARLVEFDPAMPGRVLDLLQAKPKRTFYCDIIASQLDADRFDYLLRDNLMTGSQYGGFDLQWLLHALTIDQTNDRLAVTWKGISAVEAYLQSRYHMYRNVYFHKVVRTAEGMVRLALQRAKRLVVQERFAWPGRDDVVYKALLGQRLSIEEFTELDDVSFQHCLKLWSHAEDGVLAGLCKGLLYRQLYKTIDLTGIADAGVVESLVAAAGQAVSAAGGDPAYDLFFDAPENTPYEFFRGKISDAASASKSTDILVQDADGRLTSFSEISPLTQALHRQLMFRRLHVAPAYRSVVLAAVRQ